MKLLYAEDEPALSEAVVDYLTYHKYIVDAVYDGADAYDYAILGDYDGIILDIMMPKRDGLEVLSALRRNGCKTPVLLLTAKTQVEDRIQGLDTGADDYLPKPFASREFIARVKALSRRSAGYAEAFLVFGDLRLDRNRYLLGCGEQWVRLNNKEFQLMELFLRHPQFVFSTDHLMDKIWGQDSESGIDVVWTHIGFVRRKLREMGSRVEIRTIRGAGYSLEETGC